MRIVRDTEVVTGFTLDAPFPHVPGVTHCGEALCTRQHRLSLHAHAGIELMYVSLGSVAWQVGDRRIDQTAGQLCVVSPRVKHATAFRPHAEFRALYAGLDLPAFARAGAALQSRLMTRPAWNLGRATEFEPILRNLYTEALSGRHATRVVIKLAELLIELIEARLENKKMGRRPIGLHALPVQKAIRLLQDNLHREVSITEMALTAHYAKSHFAFLFKRETGLSPAAFHRMLRLEQARHRLRNPESTVAQIAHEFGFSSSQHFSTLYRKSFGCSPSEERKI